MWDSNSLNGPLLKDESQNEIMWQTALEKMSRETRRYRICSHNLSSLGQQLKRYLFSVTLTQRFFSEITIRYYSLPTNHTSFSCGKSEFRSLIFFSFAFIHVSWWLQMLHAAASFHKVTPKKWWYELKCSKKVCSFLII